MILSMGNHSALNAAVVEDGFPLYLDRRGTIELVVWEEDSSFVMAPWDFNHKFQS